MRKVEGSRMVPVPSFYLAAFSRYSRFRLSLPVPAISRHVRQRTFSNKKSKGTFSFRVQRRCPFPNRRSRSREIVKFRIPRIEYFVQMEITELDR